MKTILTIIGIAIVLMIGCFVLGYSFGKKEVRQAIAREFEWMTVEGKLDSPENRNAFFLFSHGGTITVGDWHSLLRFVDLLHKQVQTGMDAAQIARQTGHNSCHPQRMDSFPFEDERTWYSLAFTKRTRLVYAIEGKTLAWSILDEGSKMSHLQIVEGGKTMTLKNRNPSPVPFDINQRLKEKLGTPPVNSTQAEVIPPNAL